MQSASALLIPLLLFSTLLPAADDGSGSVPRDNSYTLDSAYAKYRVQYPFISPRRCNPENWNLRHSGIVYSAIGPRRLNLDIFADDKAPARPRPVVLLIHGGGWRSGDRSLMYPLADYLSKNGFVAVPVEYRLSPEARYPAAVEDIRSAIAWVREHGPDYQADPNRIVLLGCSSGAQLAGLVGLTEGTGEGPGEPGSRAIQAIVNIDGIMDFSSAEARKYEDDPRKEETSAGLWLGGRYDEREAVWKSASPVYHVTRDAPPIQFINSSQARFHVGRDEVIAKLNRHGIYSTVYTLEDAPHCFWLFDPWFEVTAGQVSDFLGTLFPEREDAESVEDPDNQTASAN